MDGVGNGATVVCGFSVAKVDAHEGHELFSRRTALINTELLAGVGTETFWRPLRIPDEFDSGITDARDAQHPLFDLIGNMSGRRAAGRRKGHLNFDMITAGISRIRRLYPHFVNQTEVDNVDRNLRVVAFP